MAPYRVASVAARSLPSALHRPVTRAAGLAASRIMPDAHHMLARHLTRVQPELTAHDAAKASRRGMASYARYWIESLRLPHLSSEGIESGFRTDGYRYIVDALAEGNGVVVALPHLGGWEWAGRWLAERGYGVTVVVERLEPAEVFEWFADLRSSLGMKVVPLDKAAGTEVLGALRRNEVVCLLSDRDIANNGVEVEFFGETTTLPAGPAVVSLRSGAPLVPVAVYFTDSADGHAAIALPPINTTRSSDGIRADVARVTNDLARSLEDLIGRAPEQWHLLQPNWPGDEAVS